MHNKKSINLDLAETVDSLGSFRYRANDAWSHDLFEALAEKRHHL
jgi:hypothetical protein